MGSDTASMIKQLMNGETAVCTICKRGILKPTYSSDPKTALHFTCSNCGEKLIIKPKRKDN